MVTSVWLIPMVSLAISRSWSVGQVFHTTEPEGSRAGAEAMTKQSGLGAIAAFMNAEAFRVSVRNLQGVIDV